MAGRRWRGAAPRTAGGRLAPGRPREAPDPRRGVARGKRRILTCGPARPGRRSPTGGGSGQAGRGCADGGGGAGVGKCTFPDPVSALRVRATRLACCRAFPPSPVRGGRRDRAGCARVRGRFGAPSPRRCARRNVEAELVAERTALDAGPAADRRAAAEDARGLAHVLAQSRRLGTADDAGLEAACRRRRPVRSTGRRRTRCRPGRWSTTATRARCFHLVELAPAATLAPGTPVTLAARADWLVCKETCIPEGADLTLTLPVAAASATDPTLGRADRRDARGAAAAARRLAGERAGQRRRPIALTLAPPPGAADPGDAALLPVRRGEDRALGAADARARRRRVRPDAAGREHARAATSAAWPAWSPPAGGFGAGQRTGAGAATVARRRSTCRSPARRRRPQARAGRGARAQRARRSRPAGGDIGARSRRSLFARRRRADPQPDALRVPGAVAQGARLRDAPRQQGDAAPRGGRVRRRRRAAPSSSLGLLLAALRAAGEQLGWGFQLQSPAVVTALALLFFVLALNLSGVFEFGQLRAVRASPAGRRKNRTLDAFGSGVLAVVVASPCTAPFMGAALGYALDRLDGDHAGRVRRARRRHGAAVRAARVVPRLARAGCRSPGPWLERFKQLLAFPLYATVIWLAWVLGAQRDNDAVLRLLVALLGAGLRAVGVADRPRRRRARLGGRGARGAGRRRGRGLAAGHRRCRRGRAAAAPAPRRARPTGSRTRRRSSPSSPAAAGRCSSTSPPPGASPARSTSSWC